MDGAAESGYPDDYQDYLRGLPCYEPPRSGRRRLGARLFLAFWLPVFALMEMITKRAIAWKKDNSGEVPWAVVLLVRSVMKVMWSYHDYVHAPIWGRGDGRQVETLGRDTCMC